MEKKQTKNVTEKAPSLSYNNQEKGNQKERKKREEREERKREREKT